MELIDDNYNSVPRLNSSFFDLLDSQGDIEHLKNLIPVGEPKLTPCDFFVNSKTFNLLKGLFQSESLAPTHVLLYGPSGVGKTQFARTLAKEVDNLAYEVPVKDSENTRSTHRINVILAGAIARRFNNAMLIIDEADDLLNTDNYGLSMLFGGLLKESMEGKSWLDDFMDKPGLKCLWIVNNHKRLPESVIRRFTFSLSFPNLGSKERLAIWRTSQKELVDLGSEVLSNAAIEKFANNAKVSPGVINQTFRKGLEAGATDEDTLISYVDKMIDAHRKLSKARLTTHVLADSYRPNCVNISPSVGTILDILQNLVANNRELSEISSQGLKFLFYGPSGTGKTELAQFLANTLNLELVHGRLSNILSPYVGESENELANMFDRAQAIGGLLLFDEVESFLSIRERSVNQHMTLLTNEFLVCLERFKGIFIGSTNRFSSLDPAAIRRFTFKVEFKPLGPEGRIELFDSYFQTLTGSSVNESEKKYLLSLPSITPGDYSVVADKVKWLQKDSFDNFYILENLALEASFRDSRATQNSSGLLEDKESPDKKDEGSNDPPKSIN
ncbi:MAG: AAA family ATPase [Deltaproteobacteria bacterium]|nr:AAA family ATPase [Deltaproteobacteria bacterium]